jgi:hypothetical protein
MLAACLALVAAPLLASAEPVKVSLQRVSAHSGVGSRSAEHDLARLAKRSSSPVNVPVGTNAWNYFANVTVGGGVYNLLVDTGSANTWVGANKKYLPGPNAVKYELGSHIHNMNLTFRA